MGFDLGPLMLVIRIGLIAIPIAFILTLYELFRLINWLLS